jgi:hypothetical protein
MKRFLLSASKLIAYSPFESLILDYPTGLTIQNACIWMRMDLGRLSKSQKQIYDGKFENHLTVT